jgi:hypothetical protein
MTIAKWLLDTLTNIIRWCDNILITDNKIIEIDNSIEASDVWNCEIIPDIQRW